MVILNYIPIYFNKQAVTTLFHFYVSSYPWTQSVKGMFFHHWNASNIKETAV